LYEKTNKKSEKNLNSNKKIVVKDKKYDIMMKERSGNNYPTLII